MPAAPRPSSAKRTAKARRAAIESFLKEMRGAADCITDRPLVVRPGGFDPDVLYGMAFGPLGDPVSLAAVTGGASGLKLEVRHQVRLADPDPANGIPEWRVATTAYEYRILDYHEQEWLAYHWQPGDNAGPDYPHLHVAATIRPQVTALETRSIELDKFHLPTGRTSLEAVVRLLIVEFGIAPRHDDWAARLDRAARRFRNLRRPLP